VTSTSAPPAGALTSFRVSAELYRGAAAQEAPLASGDPVRPGDQLFLEVEGSVPLHLYVLNEDREGSLYVLFPVAALDVANPLTPGVRHRLPGTVSGVIHDWSVTSAGGTETILVVASREPLSSLDAEIAAMTPASPGRAPAAAEAPIYPPLEPAALDGLRGIAGLVPSGGSPGDAPGSRLARIAEAMRDRAAGSGGIWLREYQLPNAATP
jgi:hypothetical protein